MKEYIKYFWWIYVVGIVLIFGYGFILIGHSMKYAGESTNNERVTSERVFDYADKLSEQEENKLRRKIAKYEKRIGMDIVLVTYDQPIDGTVESETERFYEEHKFGYDQPNGDGVIYLDNWYDGYTWFCTTGMAKTNYSQPMMDHLVYKVTKKTNANPYKAYSTYIDTVYHDMAGFGMYRFSRANLIFVLIPIIISGLFMAVNLRKQNAKRTTLETTYVVDGKPDVVHAEDTFLNKVVTSHTRSSSSGGGSGGGGGGGGSHGGSGGHH